MDKLRKYPDSPLTQDEWKQLDETVIDMARRQLVGRRFIDIYGPLGEGIQTITNDVYEESRFGGLSLRGESLEMTQPSKRVSMTIPILYKDFMLYWRDVAQARTLGMPLDMSAAANAAAGGALMEDDLIFNGAAEFDLPGLMNVKGRLTHLKSDWMESGNAFADIVEARNKLLKMGHSGPYALVVSPELYALLHRVHKGTNVLEIDHVRNLVTDGVYQSPTIKGRSGVLVATGRHNLDLAVAEDFDTSFLGDEQMNSLFRVYECVVLRIKRPSAICTLEETEA
ncbi:MULTISPECIES: family 1 encapsulin nanocompartment shell protein [Brevibacillus]|uniref:Type 1 encapsulin shell protein n=1 Tax=Brevibacillus invocatus TaxID=173959 RepID=A0A3M8CGB0_9BACL|nr:MULTISPECIES: family 1 encapsulin nanocompartment shell protein [Brevibacillus]MCM3081885.1 bacteriocin family protein [Brevibacillus invocatus]MCM3432291.1 bacteriocin family protein [Brevibacillus invocatus]MDH4618803.1 bacteriocin family protein [Brevibacillus sp. AY1]RNB74780.1 bacteriocin [Brevibacillus invocatus]